MVDKKKGRLALTFAALLAAAGLVSGCQAGDPGQSEKAVESDTALNVEASQSETVEAEPVEPEPAEPLEFTVVGGGDMLIHMPVADNAWAGDHWDFTGQMEPIKAYLDNADIALCNMEVPLVQDGQQPSGYPMFAAPQDLAADMAAVGWDGCSTSTNHSLDQGYAGVVKTLDLFDEAGLGHVGTARGEAEAAAPQIYVVEGEDQEVTVAHISSAHNLNGIPMPEDAPWAVQMIDADRLIKEAKEAREAGADVVIVSLHCCEVEYSTTPEEEQVFLGEALAQSGEVDLVLSHHAHVPKTIDLLEGGPNGNGMWVAYGLGNFISNQSTECCIEETSSGLLAYFTFLKDEDEQPKIVDASWQVVTVDRPGGHLVYPLYETGAEGSSISWEEANRRHAGIAAILEGSPASEMDGPPAANENTTTVVPRS